jgi:tetratricopeptide (TPR) repeat protein
MTRHGNIATRRQRQQAQALLQENRLEEARDLYLQVCSIDPDDADSWALAGVILGRLGQLQEAASCFRKTVALRPALAEAHYNLGKALRGIGLLQEAATSYEAALRLRPDWVEAMQNLGNVLRSLGRLREAETCYRRVLTLDPRYSRAWEALGDVLLSLGKLDESMDCFMRLEAVIPGSIEARIGQATVLERRGDVEQASGMAGQLIEAGTRDLRVDLLYAAAREPEEAIALLEPWLAREDPGTGEQPRAALHFALGDLYDRRQDYRRAFGHYQEAHRLKARTFDLPGFSSFIGDLISVFTPEFMASAPRATHGSGRPVFIIGMPRSGTTLVEQILSSHPEVFGAGELEEIRQISLEMLEADGNGRLLPDCLGDLSMDACNRYATRYLDHLDALAGGATHVTDKMPQNFIGVGLIALLFPGSPIIHCRRDPLDTCLSCYVSDFGAAHDYACDLETLGGYYREYRRVMHHWTGVLHVPMLEIDYEALVADQEAVTRTLLQYCGLEWDERCLRFFDNRRNVATLSYDQVRKPVHSRSVGRWKRYEPYLQPLIRSLGTG